MRSQRGALERITYLLLAVVFVTAAQGQALGLRHCSLHDALPGVGVHLMDYGPDHDAHSGGATHAVPGSDRSHADPGAESQAESSHDHHAGAPGSCMDDCHAGTSITGLGTSAISTGVTAPRTAAGPVDGATSAVGPRHAPYELHLPNGPPPFV